MALRLSELRKKIDKEQTVGGLTYEEVRWLVVLVYEILPHVTHHHHCILKEKLLGKCTCGLERVLAKVGPIPAGIGGKR